MQLYKNNGKLLVYQNKFCIPGTPIQSGKTLRIQFNSDVSESTINGYQISGWTQSKVSDHVYDYTFDNDISELKSFPRNYHGLFFDVIPLNKMSIVDSPVLNTSNVTDFRNVFRGNLVHSYKGPIPSWNLSNATNTSDMFTDVDFKNINDLVLDVRKVENASGMFRRATQLHDVNNIDLYFENLWDADYMFAHQTHWLGTRGFEELPEGIRFGNNLRYISHMFDECAQLKHAPMLDTSNVCDMSYTFRDCENLESIPIWNCQNVTDFKHMFDGCARLKHVPMLDTLNVDDMSYTFHDCKNLESIPIWNCQNVSNFEHMLDFCYSLYDINICNVNADLDISDTACNGYYLERFIENGLADRSNESRCILKMTEAQFDSIDHYYKNLMYSKNWYTDLEYNSGTFTINGSYRLTNYDNRYEVEISDNDTVIEMNLNNDYAFSIPIIEYRSYFFSVDYYDENDNFLEQRQMAANDNKLYINIVNDTKKIELRMHSSVPHTVTYVFDKFYWSTEY